MLTRRQLLLSTSVLGLPVANALTVPDAPRGDLRLGLLQSREPFIDDNDLRGSRERAFSAYRVLLERSLDEHGPLDWVAGGAFLLGRIALTECSAGVQSFASLARSHGLRLTLGAWWRESETNIAPRLLMFDRRGRHQVLPLRINNATDGVQLQMSTRRGYGLRIKTLPALATPPGVPSVTFTGSAIIGPDGGVIARADHQAETCLVTVV